jgi:cytochrome P450
MDLHDTPAEAGMASLSFDTLKGPDGLPVLGNMLQLDSLRFHRQLEGWSEQFGKYYRLQLGPKRALVTADAAAIAAVMHDRPGMFRRSSRTSEILEELGTRGLFSAEGDDWRKQRKLVMRALTPEVIRNFFPTLVMLTERLRQRWETQVRAGQPVDILRDLKAYALDVIIWLAMGQDINTLNHPENPLQKDIEFIFNRVARRLTTPVAYWRYVKLGPDRSADAAGARIGAAVTGFIAEGRQQLEANPALRTKPANMLQALLVARDEPESGFDDGHVLGNATTMVFAGEDTTSNSIGWLIYYLAQYPAAAAQMQQEADAALTGKVLGEFAGLEKFQWLDAAVNEAMRLKPVAPFMVMESNVDTQVGNVAISKGTLVIMLLRRSSQLAHDWERPEVFDPARWMEDGKSASAQDLSRKIFPFGGGPRFCPGRYLAFAEIRMVMSMLMRNFTLHYDQAAAPVEETFTFTMTPSAMPVRLALRSDGP